MDSQRLHADRTLPAQVDARMLPWIDAPLPGVQRRLLERDGGEVAVATSVVRYRPGSRFDAHVHHAGEEYLVLEGVFSDDAGHHPAGTYVRNPPGSRHAPYSDGGCVILVKLRQMLPTQDTSVCVSADARRWRPTDHAGQETAVVYQDPYESVSFERVAAGASLWLPVARGGVELFVVEGALRPPDAGAPVLGPWTWLRRAQGADIRLDCPQGALLWTKRGHLPQPAGPAA